MDGGWPRPRTGRRAVLNEDNYKLDPFVDIRKSRRDRRSRRGAGELQDVGCPQVQGGRIRDLA